MGGGKRCVQVEVSNINCAPFSATRDGGVDQDFDDIEAGRLREHIVGNGVNTPPVFP